MISYTFRFIKVSNAVGDIYQNQIVERRFNCSATVLIYPTFGNADIITQVLINPIFGNADIITQVLINPTFGNADIITQVLIELINLLKGDDFT